ncbi:MAG: YhbY family RNA-binding protein, partial [Clostridiales bacterium]|nr:YhbY family RNA-binding protein [Clostridiales bacterium]
IKEIETALYHHELVKVAALQSCDTPVKVMCQQVCEVLQADPVQCVGNRFVVYKYISKENIEHIEI